MHSSPQTALPVLQNERADILDVLRGFALLGVLLDNIFGFTGWGFLYSTNAGGTSHMACRWNSCFE